MNSDDVIYLALLFFSICFGYVYRNIKDVNTKRNVGSLVGFLLVFLISGWHTLHILITVAVNSVIMLYMDKRKCHITSFTFSFIYLIFFRTTTCFGIPHAPPHTNLIEMMLVLKLVGLALDVQNAQFLNEKGGGGDKPEDKKLEVETMNYKLHILDIFHYAFHYCGVLTGPYFRYRTYIDHLNYPFYKYDNYIQLLAKRMIYVPVFVILYLWGNYNWPLSYTSDPEFEQRSLLYRYWYMWPTFFVFTMRMYIGMTLSECVCITSGLGVYPDFTEPKSGHGPANNFEKVKNILLDTEKLRTTTYNYETIHNINPFTFEFCPTIREALKNWNITVQYCLALNIYKRFSIKKYRTHATMAVSAIWHGVYFGYYICLCSLSFGLIVEDVWVKLLLQGKNGMALQVSKLVMLFLKMQLFCYLALAFSLLEVGKIWRYYHSVYHCMAIFYILLYFVEWLPRRYLLYRYWYMWPTFFVFTMRMYIGMTLSECACITSGLGVYPDFTEPKSGHGPTNNFEKVKNILLDTEKLRTTTYNYETIHNINPFTFEFCPTIREALKNWNITVQYWLALNIYKRFSIKKYRTHATMAVSAIWHGVYFGYHICLCSLSFGLIVEDVWVKLLLQGKNGMVIKVQIGLIKTYHY